MSLQNIKKGKINVTSFLFIALVCVFCITATDEVGTNLSMYKYLILILCIVEATFSYLKKRKNVNNTFKKEIKIFFIFIFSIILFSLIKSINVEKFSFRTIQELLFLICPIIYAFLIVNILKKDEINFLMKASLIIVFIFYIISLGLDFGKIINSFFSASFTNSTSDLESHIYCLFALAFCFYFGYYSDKKFYKYLSFLFTIMTFKRLFVLMALFIFIISNSKIKEKNISNRIYNICAIGLIVFSIVYYYSMLPENVKILEMKYDIDISKITSTRSDRLSGLLESNYNSYGFGSSTEYMYKYLYGALEMDIIKIIVELNFIPVIFLIYSYLYVGKRNFYTFSFMIFQILNLITSSSLTSSFAWILIFISLATMQRYPNKIMEENNEIN